MFDNLVWAPKLANIPPCYVFLIQIINENCILTNSGAYFSIVLDIPLYFLIALDISCIMSNRSSEYDVSYRWYNFYQYQYGLRVCDYLNMSLFVKI